jgi:hypothetical protein
MGSVRPRRGCGKKAEVEKTVKGEAAVGLQPETVGGHASQGIGPISTIGAALHNLVRPRTRKKIAAEASAETERVRRPGQGVARSPMDAGITRGLSLFLDNPNARKRR